MPAGYSHFQVEYLGMQNGNKRKCNSLKLIRIYRGHTQRAKSQLSHSSEMTSHDLSRIPLLTMRRKAHGKYCKKLVAQFTLLKVFLPYVTMVKALV